jgi:hypothetical protein
MIVKMLTHMHMVIYTCWCWHISEGGGVWAVERGLGFSLPPAELTSAGFRHFRENEMPIFHCARCENRRRSRGGGRRYFAGDRRWSRRRQTLALRLSAYPRRGQQRRRRRRWRQRLSLSVRRSGERTSVRRWAASVDRPTDASVAAERGAGAFWTASVARQTLERSRVGRVWR